MTVRFVRPVSSSAYLAKKMAWSSLLLLLMAFAAHRFGPLTTPSFLAVVILCAVLGSLSIPLALHGLAQLWTTGAQGGIASARAIILALPAIALFAVGMYLSETRPALFDVTTDIADPPAWQKQPVADQLWLSQPTFVSPASRELQEETYPGITSRRYEGALDRVYDAVIKVAAANRIKFDKDKLAKGQSQKAKPAPSRTPQSGAGANGAASSASNPAVNPPATDAAPPVPDVVPIPLPRPSPALASLLPQAQAKGDLSLQGSMRTFILGLPFDVVIRLREEEQTVLVDMRVASRYGSHDLGLSAGIAQSYLRALDAELLGIAPE